MEWVIKDIIADQYAYRHGNGWGFTYSASLAEKFASFADAANTRTEIEFTGDFTLAIVEAT